MPMAIDPGALPAPTKDEADQVWKEQHRLLEYLNTTASRAVNLLIFWNGGGAVALLSYLAAVAEARRNLLAFASLSAFLLGLVAVAITAAVMHEAARRQYNQFNHAAGKYYARRLPWKDLWISGDPPSWLRHIGYISGYSALTFAWAGSSIGVWAVLAGALPN